MVSCADQKVDLPSNPHIVPRDLNAAQRQFVVPLDA